VGSWANEILDGGIQLIDLIY
jgi:hypothetical protein